jgi:hypothetical protein
VSWKESALEGAVIKDRKNGGTKQLRAYAEDKSNPPKYVTGYGLVDATRQMGSVYTGGARSPQYVDLIRIGTVVDDAENPIVL